ncbi:alpha/beta hydrolase family protein [Alteromonas aestuariivivens]|nr:alpha/beta fold hydrolase [Alteromonas aestuariivivens]
MAEPPLLMLDNGEYQVPAIYTPASATGRGAEAEKRPAVVLLHGTASHKNEVGDLYLKLAVRLASQGIASLRIDFAGTGDSPVDYLQYDLNSATRDAFIAYQYLIKRPELDASRIGVVGFSQGGLIAQLLVAQAPEIKTLVAWSSVAGDGSQAFAGMFDALYAEAKTNGYAHMKFDWRSPLKVNVSWFEQALQQRALSELANYSGPVLAVAGSSDTVVDPSSALRLVESAGSADGRAVILKGADHIFNVLTPGASQPDALLTITQQWLTEHL